MHNFESGSISANTPKIERVNLQRDFQSAETHAERLAFLTNPENQEANRRFVERKMRELDLPPAPESDLAQTSEILLENKDNPNIERLIDQLIEKESEIQTQLEKRNSELEGLTDEKDVLDFALDKLEELYPKFTDKQRRSKVHAPRQVEILAEKADRADVAEYIRNKEGKVHFKNVSGVVENRINTLRKNIDDLTSVLTNIEKLRSLKAQS
jgi:hypothetical protein